MVRLSTALVLRSAALVRSAAYRFYVLFWFASGAGVWIGI